MSSSNRQLVFVASTMRSGSTLLKALLGEAPDVSNLSEYNFQRLARPRPNWTALADLAPERILLLKRPAWYNEIRSYPRVPSAVPAEWGGVPKVIVLVRDARETVESLRKMTFGKAEGWLRPWCDSWMARRYWAGINRNLLEFQSQAGEACRLVRYEDLVRCPVEVTGALFRFIGSQQPEGVDRYEPPPTHSWRWGRDDNSPRIRSLIVQPPRPRVPGHSRLERIIEQAPEIVSIRKRLGYQE